MRYSKVWGTTEKIFSNGSVEVHRISVNKGGYCSTHIHRFKYNQFYIENGELTIKVLQNDSGLLDSTTLTSGQSTTIDPGKKHMFFAEQDTVGYEIYWVELMENDIFRDNSGGTVEENSGLYNSRFFSKRWKRYHTKEIGISKVIDNIFGKEVNSVLDVGCGLGSYLFGLKNLGWSVTGCDKYLSNAINTIKKYMPGLEELLFEQDAGENFDLGKKFPLVMSIEVAEHLTPANSSTFVNNLTRHSDRYIILTAAAPGQRGRGHINCRNLSYWENEFKKFNFVVDDNKLLKFKAKLSNIDDLGLCKNLLVFRRIE